MGKVEDPEIAKALLGAMAAYLSPEGGALLKRRLDVGSCRDVERGRYNVGALKNLRFGYAERKSLSIGEVLSGDAVAEHQRGYRRCETSWLPPGAIPGDPADRIRLYEERHAFVAEQRGLGAAVDLSDDDLLGVGLASFATLEGAADELVRHVFRAAPRDWSVVEARELRALDRYPELARVQIPAAPELTAPLGWVPGLGPSEAAEETFRKLSSDWDGFGVVVPAVGAADADAWQSFGDAWRRRTLPPGDVGDRLVSEVKRARRIRAGLVRGDVAEAASPAFAELGRAEEVVEVEGEVEVVEEGGIRGFLAKVASPQVFVAGGFLAAMAASLFAPPSRSAEGVADDDAGPGASDVDPAYSPPGELAPGEGDSPEA